MIQRLDSCERLTVTRVVLLEGEGAEGGDPIREVIYWYEDDGRLIARRDRWAEAQARKLTPSDPEDTAR